MLCRLKDNTKPGAAGFREKKSRIRPSFRSRSESKVTYFYLFSAKSRKAENVSTVGVDVSEWVYPSQAGLVFRSTKPSITFSTWDFGGQVP